MRARTFFQSPLRLLAASGALASLLASAPAHAFDRVQPPELGVGHRASLAGALANTTFGPADVTRGGFSLPAPFSAPKDRGELGAQVFPVYNPDNGISPWGLGFATALTITRSHIGGSLTFDFAKGDELVSPFGRLTRGTDGNWYPVGLDKPARVVQSGNDFIAYLPDGSRWTFGGAARVNAPSGTYAWHLREVRDVSGHLTTLTWTANASGNLFLSQVDYGGRATAQYRIELAYELVNVIDSSGATRARFVDYRSGAPVTLDRRVKTVTVRARNAKTGAYEERYHYTLGYTQEAIGAAFYLTRIDTTFASGQTAPPVTYAYNLKGADFATSSLNEVPQLTSLFHTLGVTADAIQPARAAVTDADADGNLDLEFGDDGRTLVQQRGSGTADDPLRFETSTLPASTAPVCRSDSQVGCAYDPCRGTADPGSPLSPRLLSQLNPTDTTLQVVAFKYDSEADQTAINVCSRDGVRTAVQGVDGRWEQSQMVRFVDMDGDHKPDLVRVGYGRYDVLPNVTQTAGTEAAYAWGSRMSGALLDKNGEAFTPSAIWVSDASGDGIPDLVGQYGDAIEVWHGLGSFQFATNAEELRFFQTDGSPLGSLDHYKVIPADLNKDGLQDYFVTNADGDTTNSRFIHYFTNVGGRFVQTPIKALDTLPFSASSPVIATLDGSGNMAVTVTNAGKAYSVALEGPGTGLMASADDGKGTVLSFEYVRGPASPGIRHRYALLSKMRVQSSGYDTIAYDYRYAHPTVHSRGRFLVGFDQVTRREGDLPSAPLGTNVMTFLNGDMFGGLLLNGKQSDVRLPDAVKIEERTYADATFLGIPWKRLASSTSGWASADGSKRAVDVTSYDAYANDFCPSKTTLTTSQHGKLVTTTTRANPAALANHLHCLEADVVTAGVHADATLDFREEQSITRNDAGRITRIASLGADGPLVQQVVDYDADNDPIRITVPGKGITTIAYDPATKLATTVTAPTGVITTATRDPRTDAITDVLTDRGASKWHELATYDGQERLATHWTDLDGSTALAPRERITYTYATTNHPATTTIHTLVDAATGVYHDATELYTAAYEKMGTAQLYDAGWVFDEVRARSRAHREEDRFQVMTQPAATSLATIDYATLLKGNAGAAPIALKTTTGTSLDALDMSVASSTRLHADVTKATTTSLTVDASGKLVRKTLVNNANATTATLDPTGKIQLGYVDEAGTTFAYAYDASGRLRAVTLPDGTHHRVAYDAYGRESVITREGVQRITTAYVAANGGTTDLVASKTYASAPANGAPANVRTVAWTYDAAGRKLVETNTDVASAAKKVFTFYYDGATASTPAPAASAKTLGLLTGVAGDGYTKTFAYRGDGQPVHKQLVVTGFRTIDTAIAYREDASVRDETITVTDPSGHVLETSAHHQDVDAFGRPSKMSVNGAPLVTMAYDALGRPQTASFGTGDSVAFAYDGLTRDLVGYDETRAGNAWSGMASTRVKKNDRGFVGSEVLGVGPSSVQRTYSYSPQGFLTLAVDGAR